LGYNMDELQNMVAKFRDDRDWAKWHTVNNLILALASEAGELCHEARWGNPDMAKVREEMADVAIFLLSLADVSGVDLGQAIIDKIEKNGAKYPVKGI
jgi:NTP pyrophosphatase (non-canonical NTP hydrolase)